MFLWDNLQPADNDSYTSKSAAPNTKRCRVCDERLPLKDFPRDSRSADGRLWRCKGCHNAYFRAYRAANRARVNEIGAAYHERIKVSNPALLDRKRARRRRLEREAGTVSAATKRAIWDAHDGRCYICHGDAEQYDHVQPLAAGGKTTADNLRPVCSGCNARKGDEWPVDFDELRARIYREYRREAEEAESGAM
jgi:5-methylcytosine-specific restriction endonuclease McrA